MLLLASVSLSVAVMRTAPASQAVTGSPGVRARFVYRLAAAAGPVVLVCRGLSSSARFSPSFVHQLEARLSPWLCPSKRPLFPLPTPGRGAKWPVFQKGLGLFQGGLAKSPGSLAEVLVAPCSCQQRTPSRLGPAGLAGSLQTEQLAGRLRLAGPAPAGCSQDAW